MHNKKSRFSGLWALERDYWTRPNSMAWFIVYGVSAVFAATYITFWSLNNLLALIFWQVPRDRADYMWARTDWALVFCCMALFYLCMFGPFLFKAIVLYDHLEKQEYKRTKTARALGLKRWEEKARKARSYYNERVFKTIKPLKPPGLWTALRKDWTGPKAKPVLPIAATTLASIIYVTAWFFDTMPHQGPWIPAFAAALIQIFVWAPLVVNVFMLRMEVIVEQRDRDAQRHERVPSKDTDSGRE